MAERSWILELFSRKPFNLPEPQFLIHKKVTIKLIRKGRGRDGNEIMYMILTLLRMFSNRPPFGCLGGLSFAAPGASVAGTCWSLPSVLGGYQAKVLVLGTCHVFHSLHLLWQELCIHLLIRAWRIGGTLKFFSRRR